ncbi:MAG: O-antigen ligase family protein [Bryobacteraceae bacterium]
MTGLAPPNERFQRLSAHFLAFTMAMAVLVGFFPGRWINPSLFQAGLFLLGASWAIALAFRPFELRFNQVLIPLSATVAWGLLQLATGYTASRWDTWMAVLTWMGNLLACFLAMQACASSGIRRRFLDTLLYFAFVLSVVSVVQYFSWDGKIFWIFPTYDTAVLGPFVSRDQYAAFVEMVLSLAIARTLRGGPQSLRFAVISAALYASVIAGASRAGTLLTTAEIIVIPVVLWARGHLGRGKLRSATTNVWLLAFVFVAVVGWAVLWSRFDDPDPFKGRREMLSDTITMVRARPYFGFGLGTFRTAYPAYGSVDFGAAVNHAHNDWAEWAADGGIPFSLFLVWVAIWSLPKAFKTVWGMGVIAVFVHSTVDFPLQKPVLDLWLFALLGLLAAETRSRSQAAEQDLS